LSAVFLNGGFQTPPPAGMGIPALFAWTKTPAAFFAALALDYILAFGVLGLSFLFRRSARALLYAVPVCLTLRFLCHLVSGVVIWSEYAGDMNVWLYSLIYNGSFMGIELVFTMAAAFALWKTAPRLVTGSYIE
ncbi:MAG: energy-coupled thiamine transporter ThiT, partial [Oscillospiraceae bacterium]|nr:energy-coupled thiamine transporter ThiT [Oscillospiraceae bacterium]